MSKARVLTVDGVSGVSPLLARARNDGSSLAMTMLADNPMPPSRFSQIRADVSPEGLPAARPLSCRWHRLANDRFRD
jgi:hypothetical protein